MEEEAFVCDEDTHKVREFKELLNSTDWMSTANEEKINSIFSQLAEFENSVLTEENHKMYPEINFKDSIKLVMENIIKSPVVSEHLTLHAIKKYISMYSSHDFCEVLENLFAELELRKHLVQLKEEVIDVDFDLSRINSLIDEILNNQTPEVKVVNALKSQTLDVLQAGVHASPIKGQSFMNKITDCLESQEDLKLWFYVMKEENIEYVLELCMKYENFLQAVLIFFDKFANEIESNYDEDLNVKYSHVNLDFEDFVKIFQKFLNSKQLGGVIGKYLDGKIMLEESNFCFWIDVKACVGFT